MAVDKFIPIKNEAEPEFDERLEAFSSPCENKEPYVLMVLGDSMEPEFKEGDVIVIEPGHPVQDGHYVIAHHNNDYILRKLRVVGDQLFLEPENHAYAAEQIDSVDQIKGVITQKKSPGGGRKNRKQYV